MLQIAGEVVRLFLLNLLVVFFRNNDIPLSIIFPREILQLILQGSKSALFVCEAVDLWGVCELIFFNFVCWLFRSRFVAVYI